MEIKEKLKDDTGISITFNNLALIYLSQHENEKAMELLNKSLKIRRANNDNKGISTVLVNIAGVYMDQHKVIKAETIYEESLKYAEASGDFRTIATSLSSLGVACNKNGNKSRAMNCYEKSLNLREILQDKNGVAYSLHNMGFLFYESNELQKAKFYFEKSYKLAKELGFPNTLKDVLKGLYVTHRGLKNYKEALETYSEYIVMQDSITNESTRKASIRSQLKYEYEKQAAADSVSHAKESEIKNVELKRQSAEIKAKKNQQYALFGGLILVILFSVFMFNRWKVTQKQKAIIEVQKEIVEEQKLLVEEKQKEIVDSIHYAKRIQLAQIPSEKLISRLLSRFIK